MANKYVSSFAWKINNGKKVKITNMKWVNGHIPPLKYDPMLIGIGWKSLLLDNKITKAVLECDNGEREI